MNADTTRAFAYLSRVIEGPSRSLTDLLAQGHSAGEIAMGVRKRETWIGTLLGETQARFDIDCSDEDLERAHALGARLIHVGHPEWPARQLDQAFGFAARGESPHVRSYQSDAVAPHALWVRGGKLPELFA